MKRWVWGLTVLVMIAVLVGCSGGGDSRDEVLSQSWSDIEASAKGSLVKFYMYGGQSEVNQWIDSYVAEEVKKQYGITLVRVPIGADTVIKKLVAAKNGGDNSDAIDLFWVNGKNFRAARDNELLFGPFTEKLPNFVKYVDKRIAAYDFGYSVDGYEAPLGRTQFVFEYDSRVVKNPPKNYMQLLKWVAENPGRFTYPAPPDFTGSAFVRQAFYSMAGGPVRFEAGWDKAKYDNAAPRVWEYLDEMKPYLWRAGMEYPESSSELDAMFASGEILISMAYGPQHASQKIRGKEFSPEVRTYVMDEGTLFNMHFVAIPKISANKAGAMVVANFLLSPDAQVSKFKPESWGDYPALQLNALTKEHWDAFAAVERDESTLDPDMLAKKSVPEIGAEYVEALEKGWNKHIK